MSFQCLSYNVYKEVCWNVFPHVCQKLIHCYSLTTYTAVSRLPFLNLQANYQNGISGMLRCYEFTLLQWDS